LRWFGASPCRAAPEDLPPSSIQHYVERPYLLTSAFLCIRGTRTTERKGTVRSQRSSSSNDRLLKIAHQAAEKPRAAFKNSFNNPGVPQLSGAVFGDDRGMSTQPESAELLAPEPATPTDIKIGYALTVPFCSHVPQGPTTSAAWDARRRRRTSLFLLNPFDTGTTPWPQLAAICAKPCGYLNSYDGDWTCTCFTSGRLPGWLIQRTWSFRFLPPSTTPRA
jgi:hypothetical protein